jgi:hypothetical protein
VRLSVLRRPVGIDSITIVAGHRLQRSGRGARGIAAGDDDVALMLDGQQFAIEVGRGKGAEAMCVCARDTIELTCLLGRAVGLRRRSVGLRLCRPPLP